MYNLNWSRKELSRLKLGAFGEYYAKTSLASYGIDIYSAEVDDHGVDFVAESNGRFLKFQVKTIRKNTTNYIFVKKAGFDISDESLYLMLLMLQDGEHPMIYLFPATTWNNPSSVFVYHSYEGKKSEPEYGINLSAKNIAELEPFKLENQLSALL